MPHTPNRPCRQPGCPGFCQPGQVYCKAHSQYTYDRLRGSSSERGYNKDWQKARGLFLKAHPLCAVCFSEGRLNPATVVDHIIPHRGDKALFWDRNNWQALCKECHDKKTGSGL